jgi:tRNA dimethylallyltransferase
MVRLTPRLLAIVGATATGKSALGIAMAQRFDGEIVSCDSTAVYRGFDIGTDKVPLLEQRGIPHHMVDLVEPTEEYSAARYAREASAVIRGITSRGRLPILVGGTGLYYRALTRGMFEGPGRDEPLRRRLERIAVRRGPSCLHRWLGKVDPPSAERIQIPDVKRLVRALEVWIVTGRPLTGHFADTASPLADYEITTVALRIPEEDTAARVARRVDAQFERGLLDEMRALLARGVPETALPFTGLVYRQALELIVRENRKYSRRQLIWFRKEPNLRWIHAAGERADTEDEVARLL